MPTLTLLGSEDGLMVRINSSSFSNMLSLIIGTSNEAVVVPADNMTSYGPDA